ncbi:MAG: hypothetical protein WDZ35_09965 [Crocinitomicaceae bacterium]
MESSMDYFIQITFVLLVLSMIAEKVTNFIKLNYPDNPIKAFFNREPKLGKNATIEDFESLKETKRQREVQTLAILISLTLAFGCRANLFKIYDPTFELGWININWSTYSIRDGVSDFFGCGLSGIFLSLGSKFFHDLLGLLMESKNLKRKLKNREAVSDLRSIDEVDQYIAKLEPAIVEQQLGEKIKKMPAVKSWEYSELDNTVDIYLGDISEEERKQLERFVEVQLSDRKMKGVEVNYIYL